jgi:hypothetical protein
MAVIGTFPVFADAALFTTAASLDPTTVPKRAVQVETFPVTGLTTDMQLIVDAPALEAGLFLIGAEVSATDTLKLTFWNSKNMNINPALQTFNIKAF